MTDSYMLRLDRREVDEFDHSMPDLGWAIAQQVAHYLNDVLVKTSRVAFRPVPTRVADPFLQLSFGQSGAAIHRADLAPAVGSVSEVVARTLIPLRDNGLVSVDPHGVTAITNRALDYWTIAATKPLYHSGNITP